MRELRNTNLHIFHIISKVPFGSTTELKNLVTIFVICEWLDYEL
jgi:hypothetical protein